MSLYSSVKISLDGDLQGDLAGLGDLNHQTKSIPNTKYTS
jgi:hypothetical protein